MKKRLSFKILGPVLLLVILQLVCNTFATMNMKNMHKSSGVISESYLPAVQTAGDITVRIERIQRYVQMYISSTDINYKDMRQKEIETEKVAIAEQMEVIAAINEKLDDVHINECFETLKAEYENCMQVAEEVMKIDDSFKANQASKRDLNPALDAYDEAAAAFLSTYNEETEMATAEQTKVFDGALAVNVTLGIISMLVGIGIAIITAFTVIKPAQRAKAELADIVDSIEQNQGDLNERITITTQDEIGQLSVGINTFIERLQGIIRQIKGQTIILEGAAVEASDQVEKSNGEVNDVSAAMEELAAGMEEVSATVQELNDRATDVMNASKTISDRAERGSDFAKEIKSSAEEIRSNAEMSQTMAYDMVREIRAILKQSIENSRNVEKIRDLTTDILNISGQTNLLALNASIEAARAGEAGRGFAVVAEEIGVLAEDSRNTANNIQVISELVNSAVAELSSNADRMLEFIDTTVLNDYGQFVSVAEQYEKNAMSIDDMMEDFSSHAVQLDNTMVQVNDSMESIAATVEESAEGIATVATSATELVEMMGNICNVIDKNNQISRDLQSEVNCFLDE